jgi:hypothetical protein
MIWVAPAALAASRRSWTAWVCLPPVLTVIAGGHLLAWTPQQSRGWPQHLPLAWQASAGNGLDSDWVWRKGSSLLGIGGSMVVILTFAMMVRGSGALGLVLLPLKSKVSKSDSLAAPLLEWTKCLRCIRSCLVTSGWASGPWKHWSHVVWLCVCSERVRIFCSLSLGYLVSSDSGEMG